MLHTHKKKIKSIHVPSVSTMSLLYICGVSPVNAGLVHFMVETDAAATVAGSLTLRD
jgi:hypothetical protein